MRRELTLRIPTGEVLHRISCAIGDQVAGEVNSKGFHISARITGVNSWAPVLHGVVDTAGQGALLRLDVEEPGFLISEILGILFGSIGMFMFATKALPSPSISFWEKLTGLLGIGAIVIVGILIGVLGRRSGRRDLEFLLRFVEGLFADARVG